MEREMTKAELIEFFKTREFVFTNVDYKEMEKAKVKSRKMLRELDEQYKNDANFRALVDSIKAAASRR